MTPFDQSETERNDRCRIRLDCVHAAVGIHRSNAFNAMPLDPAKVMETAKVIAEFVEEAS